MNNSVKTTNHHRFALLLGALGIVAVACSDDDDAIGTKGGAGSGGTSAGSSNAGSSSGGTSAGKPSGGTSSAGTSSAGTSNAGTSSAGTSSAGTSSAGTGGASAGSSATGGDAGVAGEAMGGAAMGGQGGDSIGGGAGSAQAGAGGAPEVVADVLDDPNFSAYGTGWSEEGDVDASTFKWIYAQEPGLNHWAATAYKVATLQTLDPLPNGTYSFSMDVERAANLNDQHLFARGCKAGEPNTEVTMSTAAAGTSSFMTITLANIEVSSGSCTVGIYTDAPADGWANIDNAVFALQ